MWVLSFDNFNWCSTSIKEINRLISKEMRVLLFDSFSGFSFKDFKHLISRKTDVFKASIFREKKFEEMH